MGTWLRGRALGVAIATLLLAGTGAGPMAAPVDARACPGQPLHVADLHRLQGERELLILADVIHAGRRCYGSAPIRVVGYVDEPQIMGWEGPWYLEPAWLGGIGLAMYGSAAKRDQASGERSVLLAWHGERGLTARYMHEWVVVTAHFDDPAARSCHATGTNGPSRASLVRQCRSVLVIESVRSLGSVDTATAPVMAGGSGAVPANERGPGAVLALGGLLGAMAWLGHGRSRRRGHA